LKGCHAEGAAAGDGVCWFELKEVIRPRYLEWA